MMEHTATAASAANGKDSLVQIAAPSSDHCLRPDFYYITASYMAYVIQSKFVKNNRRQWVISPPVQQSQFQKFRLFRYA